MAHKHNHPFMISKMILFIFRYQNVSLFITVGISQLLVVLSPLNERRVESGVNEARAGENGSLSSPDLQSLWG